MEAQTKPTKKSGNNGADEGEKILDKATNIPFMLLVGCTIMLIGNTVLFIQFFC